LKRSERTITAVLKNGDGGACITFHGSQVVIHLGVVVIDIVAQKHLDSQVNGNG